jgi:hypothetical protein
VLSLLELVPTGTVNGDPKQQQQQQQSERDANHMPCAGNLFVQKIATSAEI